MTSACGIRKPPSHGPAAVKQDGDDYPPAATGYGINRSPVLTMMPLLITRQLNCPFLPYRGKALVCVHYSTFSGNRVPGKSDVTQTRKDTNCFKVSIEEKERTRIRTIFIISEKNRGGPCEGFVGLKIFNRLTNGYDK